MSHQPCLQSFRHDPTRRLHATCSEPPRNHIISKLHVVFNGCVEVLCKLREVFLLGNHYYPNSFLSKLYKQRL